MTQRSPSWPHPVTGVRRVPWRVSSLLIALWATACESPVAPAACGPLPQVTVNVGETSSVAVCFNDANGDMLSHTAVSSNPSVATASISGTSITVTGVAPGNSTVTVTASDPGGLQGQSSFAVMVPNRAPQPRGTPPDVTVQVGANTTVDAAQYFSEPDGEALSYTASSSDAEVAGASVSGSTITVTAEAKGRATITVTASDPGGLSATQSFRLTVPNRPPAPVGAIGAQTIEVGQSITLDVAGSFTDPDGDALTYTAASSIAAVVRTSTSGSMVTITAAGPGTATVTITASDDDRATATQQLSVTVPQPNRAPRRVGSIPSRTITVGERATVNASQYFSDPDGDVLTYAASSSNGGVAGVSVSGSTVTITGAGAGSATITVTARDPGGLSATQQARVTVSQSNRAPRPVGTIPSRTITVGGRTTVNASQFFSDPDGDALTYSASSSNSGVARASVSGSTVTITGAGAGSATITVTARDPGGLGATQRFSATVRSAGAPDLEFTNVTPTSVTGTPGGTVQADFTVSNTGTAMAAATTMRIFLSTNSTISTTDTEGGNAAFRSLAVGQSRTITGTVRLPSQDSGTFYFGICIDAVAGESDTGNNCSQGVRVTVGGSGGPDLVVSVSRSSATVSPGGEFSYDITVRNKGNAVAAATRVRTFSSTDANISTNDTQIGSAASVPSLGPSQEASGTRAITVSAGAPAGTVHLGECVDAVSGESDTNNNCSSAITVTIQTGGGGSDTTYTTGQTIETLPTGFWSPDQTGGGIVFQFSNGVATVQFSGTSSYIVENNIRYSCLSSGGCEIVNRRVTKGSIRASRQSGGSLIAEPQWEGLLRAVGTDGALMPVPSGDAPPRIRGVEGTLRVKPGGESDAGAASPAQGAAIGATILFEKRKEP